jgi:hypothetical protein
MPFSVQSSFLLHRAEGRDNEEKERPALSGKGWDILGEEYSQRLNAAGYPAGGVAPPDAVPRRVADLHCLLILRIEESADGSGPEVSGLCRKSLKSGNPMGKPHKRFCTKQGREMSGVRSP